MSNCRNARTSTSAIDNSFSLSLFAFLADHIPSAAHPLGVHHRKHMLAGFQVVILVIPCSPAPHFPVVFFPETLLDALAE